MSRGVRAQLRSPIRTTGLGRWAEPEEAEAEEEEEGEEVFLRPAIKFASAWSLEEFFCFVFVLF